MCPWCRIQDEQTDAEADTARPVERESGLLEMINDTPIIRKGIESISPAAPLPMTCRHRL